MLQRKIDMKAKNTKRWTNKYHKVVNCKYCMLTSTKFVQKLRELNKGKHIYKVQMFNKHDHAKAAKLSIS